MRFSDGVGVPVPNNRNRIVLLPVKAFIAVALYHAEHLGAAHRHFHQVLAPNDVAAEFFGDCGFRQRHFCQQPNSDNQRTRFAGAVCFDGQSRRKNYYAKAGKLAEEL